MAWLNATTSVSSAITALIGDGVTIRSAGTVQLQAETFNADATSNVTVGAGGGGCPVDGVTVIGHQQPDHHRRGRRRREDRICQPGRR